MNCNNCTPRFIKQTDRLIDLPVVTASFFRSLGNAIVDKSHRKLSNYTTKPNDIIYIGEEYYKEFTDYLPSINASFILISHWSDLNITLEDFRVIIENPNLIV